MRSDPEGIVEALLIAYAIGDYEAAAAYYAPHAVFAMYADNEISPFAGEWQGREEIINCWQDIRNGFDILRFEGRNIRSGSDNVFHCQVSYELLQKESGLTLQGIARLELEFRDGLIVREREYNDVERLRAFLRLCRNDAKPIAFVSGKQP
jgi:ketosteroid isomerase-like protein